MQINGSVVLTQLRQPGDATSLRDLRTIRPRRPRSRLAATTIIRFFSMATAALETSGSSRPLSDIFARKGASMPLVLIVLIIPSLATAASAAVKRSTES